MGLLSRFRKEPPPPPDYAPDDAALVLLADSPDPAVADSAVLREAQARGADLAQHVLVRHRVVGLTRDPEAFAAQLDPSYRVLWSGADAVVYRTEVVTAMSLSQERSRMAGLAQRHGGDVAGYDLLAPADPAQRSDGSLGSGA